MEGAHGNILILVCRSITFVHDSKFCSTRHTHFVPAMGRETYRKDGRRMSIYFNIRYIMVKVKKQLMT